MTSLWPLALVWVGGAVLALCDGRRAAVQAAALAVLGVHLAGLGALLSGGPHPDVLVGGWPAGLGIRLDPDPLGLGFATAASAVVFAGLLFEVGRPIAWPALPALVVLLTAGLDGLFLTGDAFDFYVFFEVSMLASFTLAAYGRGGSRSREALVFTTVNLVGSTLFLSAVGALYHVRGTLDLDALGASVAGPAALPIAALFLAAFGLKIGLFPFHSWVPGVYTGTVPGVAAILAGGVASIGTYGLLRFGRVVFATEVEAARPVLVGLAAVTVVYGAWIAAWRSRPAALASYGAVSQAGYVLLALAIGTADGDAAAALFGVSNALDKGLLFLSIGLKGRLAGPAALIGTLSAAGLPPGVGFFVKLALLRAAALADRWEVFAIVAVGGAASLLYAVRLQELLSSGERDEAPAGTRPARVAVLALAAALIAGGLAPGPAVAWSERAAAELAPRGAP